MKPGSPKTFDTIGREYNATRAADPRILDAVVRLLACGTDDPLADVGAGTGNYAFGLAEKGHCVYAVEPSKTMMAQAKPHPKITWVHGFAEEIPLMTESCGGAVCILVAHHFKSMKDAFCEIRRILKPGASFVLFTADPAKIGEGCWIRDYFGTLFKGSEKKLPGTKAVLEMLEHIFSARAAAEPFPLPPDLTDQFFIRRGGIPKSSLTRNSERTSPFSPWPIRTGSRRARTGSRRTWQAARGTGNTAVSGPRAVTTADTGS